MIKPNKFEMENRLKFMMKEIQGIEFKEDDPKTVYGLIRLGMFLSEYERYLDRYIGLDIELVTFHNNMLQLYIELRKKVYPDG